MYLIILFCIKVNNDDTELVFTFKYYFVQKKKKKDKYIDMCFFNFANGIHRILLNECGKTLVIIIYICIYIYIYI